MGETFDLAADELYGLPLEEFVPRRDELAREMRAAGNRDDADQIKKLVKPSAPAWAVNQLVRSRPDEIRELIEAGDDLRRVQEWLLRREADPADLRAAVESERAAVGKLVRAAADLLTDAGRAARGDVLERIGETLHAAAADTEVRKDLERGRVVRDRAAVGLGAVAAAAPAGATRRASASGSAGATRRRTPAKRPPEGEPSAAAQRAAADAREALLAAEAEAKAAERMQAAADRAVERAERALEAAEATWERAREGLREAGDDLAAAQKAARAAQIAAETAEAQAQERRRAAGGDA